MGQSYDVVQTVFQLSLASNGASDIQATQEELQQYLSAYLNGGTDPLGNQFAGFFPQMNPSLAGGDWKVVWGPCVYSRFPNLASYATNAMYVAYSATLSTYVVSIAATNPKSLTDWFELAGAIGAARLLASGGDYMNIPQTPFQPDWGTWVWTQGQYPPAWQPLPRFTDDNPAKLSDMGELILATHINQYYRFFNVVPAPRMAINPEAQAAADAKRRFLLAAARL